jgi:hypothetical protein
MVSGREVDLWRTIYIWCVETHTSNRGEVSGMDVVVVGGIVLVTLAMVVLWAR